MVKKQIEFYEALYLIDAMLESKPSLMHTTKHANLNILAIFNSS